MHCETHAVLCAFRKKKSIKNSTKFEKKSFVGPLKIELSRLPLSVNNNIVLYAYCNSATQFLNHPFYYRNKTIIYINEKKNRIDGGRDCSERLN